MEKFEDKYKKLLDELAKLFSEYMEKEGWWDSDYSLWVTEYEAWTPDDMKLIVSRCEDMLETSPKYISDYLDKLQDDVNDWVDYNVTAHRIGVNQINLKSWLNGAPRMRKDEIDRIEFLQKELFEETNKLKEKYK